MSELIWYDLKMTSNTTPSPFVASASSEATTSAQAWKAFDGSNSVSTDAWVASATQAWIQLYFGEKKSVNKVKITARNSASWGTSACPKDFEILGSNNGNDFIVLATIVNELNWISNETREYSFQNNEPYSYYRINVLNNNGKEGYIDIGEIVFGLHANKKLIIKNSQTNQYYSLADKTLIPLPDVSDKNMILHGIEAGKEIILDEAFDKINYPIENVDSNKNSDGLLVLDLINKPLSIKL